MWSHEWIENVIILIFIVIKRPILLTDLFFVFIIVLVEIWYPKKPMR